MNNETQRQVYIELDRYEVTRRARQLWEAGGRPAGRSLEYWLQAELELLLSRRNRPFGRSSLNEHPRLGARSSGKAHRSKRWSY
jgi:hypothetical protein